jgi:type IV pilus assembly protein PilC
MGASGSKVVRVATTKTEELSAASLSLLFSDLELVYHSGLALTEGFDVLKSNAANREQERRMEVLYRAVSNGSSIHDALQQMGGIPAYALQLTRIGEQTGRLEQTFASLRDYYDRRDELQHSVRAALAYPLAMMVMVLVVVVLLLTQAMPVFARVFAQLGYTMTGVAAVLLNVGNAIGGSAVYIVVALLIIALVLVLVHATAPGKRAFNTLYQVFPLTRGLSRSMATQRFTLALSALLKAGMPVDEALELAEPLVTDRFCAARVHQMREALASGKDFPKAVQESQLYPPASMALLAVAFKTGTDSTALDQIGDSLALRTQARLESLIGAIEPTLVAIMCVLVGLILLAVMLPLLGALASI